MKYMEIERVYIWKLSTEAWIQILSLVFASYASSIFI